MLDSGLVQEVEKLTKKGLGINNQCMQGIGYKEVLEYLNGNLTFIEMQELIKLNTRHYAKRQITFFKKVPNMISLKANDVKSMAKRIVDEL